MAHEQAADGLILGGSAWIAMSVAFVAYFLLSFLWWGPIFGKKWAGERGLSMEGIDGMAKPLVFQAIGTFLGAYVFCNMQATFFVTRAADTGLMVGVGHG
jgi:hypothetical protein